MIKTAVWPALGTTASVHVTDAGALGRACEIVDRELQAIDRACSRFDPGSELSRLNAAAGRPFTAGPLLLEAITVALRAAALTDGIVTPTIGAALELAGYDRDFAQVVPRRGAVRASIVPGWRAVRLDPARRLVSLPPGVRLDLGATAKALAADRAAAAVAAAVPETDVLVNLGGDVATAGAPPGGWTVMVCEDHRAPPGAPGQLCRVHGALATSSTTVRRWGPSAHHLLDPRTGTPATGPWRTATVAAATCVDANIASTAAIVLGEAAAEWLGSRALPARLVATDGSVHVVAGWPQERLAA